MFQPLYVQDNKLELAKVSNKIIYILSFEKLIKLLIPMLRITSYNVHYNELVKNIEFQTQQQECRDVQVNSLIIFSNDKI